ncbi:hypothetical protein [Thermosulfurimonas sp. F29]|uniref:hypothetical protein n=1 Tax=Thermosulfurimonas sp. F29 TaxID=2867247 RepID=UPI0021029557|nr:hypothetical protein [Thermosulfurimonas sp. F29]
MRQRELFLLLAALIFLFKATGWMTARWIKGEQLAVRQLERRQAALRKDVRRLRDLAESLRFRHEKTVFRRIGFAEAAQRLPAGLMLFREAKGSRRWMLRTPLRSPADLEAALALLHERLGPGIFAFERFVLPSPDEPGGKTTGEGGYADFAVFFETRKCPFPVRVEASDEEFLRWQVGPNPFCPDEKGVR